MAADGSLILNLLSTANDIDSSTLTPVIVSNPTHGTLVKNTDGTYTYTPEANFNGSDSFSYQVSDGALSSGVATANLTITPVKRCAHHRRDQSNSGRRRQPILNLLSTANDIDSSTLTP
ncbi:MAG: cadherin-like domain-containing protein [Moraxellaceae bacterium]|nr:cadherin-like domain-containing protein [Moraxellaceae bacterium]